MLPFVCGLSARPERDAWLRNELGVKLRSNGVERAAPRATSALAPFVLIDEAKLPLDLAKVYVHFPGTGQRRPALVEALRGLGVVRQVLVTRSRRDVVCILICRAEDRHALFDAVEHLGEPFVWDDVLDEDRSIERETWIALSRRFAAAEDLLEG